MNAILVYMFIGVHGNVHECVCVNDYSHGANESIYYICLSVSVCQDSCLSVRCK